MDGAGIKIWAHSPVSDLHHQVVVDDEGSLDKANWLILIDYVGGPNPIYVGEAPPGTSAAALSWRIKRITWAAGNPTAVEWANGSAAMVHIWNERDLYSYS